MKERGYQCRPWLAGVGSVNLGCFSEEWSAGRTAREFVKRHQPGADLCEVLNGRRRDGFVPAHVRMKFVYDLPDGVNFGARVKKNGRLIELPGPYHTEREAFEAMRERLSSVETIGFPVGIAGRKPAFMVRGLASRMVACRQLGISPADFDRYWEGVFTDPRRAARCDSPERMVIANELEVAIEAGGGCSDQARGAVALYRIGLGRM